MFSGIPRPAPQSPLRCIRLRCTSRFDLCKLAAQLAVGSRPTRCWVAPNSLLGRPMQQRVGPVQTRVRFSVSGPGTGHWTGRGHRYRSALVKEVKAAIKSARSCRCSSTGQGEENLILISGLPCRPPCLTLWSVATHVPPL